MSPPRRRILIRARFLALVALVAPRLFSIMRAGIVRSFESRAAEWDKIVGPLHTAALQSALQSELVRSAAGSGGTIIDVGCGTGAGTEILVREFPDHRVIGLDLSYAMLRRAASKDALADAGVLFVVCDASRPPIRKGAVCLALVMNAPPFVAALAPLLGAGGALLFVWSEERRTPIWISPLLIKLGCRVHGLRRFEEGHAGGGSWLVAVRN